MKLSRTVDLTHGSIPKRILQFALPLFLGQLLQQMYNMADAWVVGNFADNDSFAAVSSGGNITFLVIGLFSGIAIGGGVVISRYFGAGNIEDTRRAIHANFLVGIIASVIGTVIGLVLVPNMLVWMKTPESVLPQSLAYFRVYFAGVSTIIMYNIGTSIMQALGDSFHPLCYLAVSSVVNVILDLLFVAVLHKGVMGAAIATVIAQGISATLCIFRLLTKGPPETRLDFRRLRFDGRMLKSVIRQGLPTGIQNSVIGLGNVVIQSNINLFGAYAMSGQGAFAKIEGIVFLPITSMSMSLPTFISQNLGAKQDDRAKKGAVFGTVFSAVFAELIGVILYFAIPKLLLFFIDDPNAIRYGVTHCRICCFYFFLLAFSHCCAGTLRGCGKALIPMGVMLGVWCGFRILYITEAIKFWPVFDTISAAYPLTWSISSILYTVAVLNINWKQVMRDMF